MCGFEDIIAPVLDVVATATGNPELIPLIQAGTTVGEDLAAGKGLGKSLVGGLESGGEALAVQEAAGAIGIGKGNSVVNDALGVNISPASTGLPDIGSYISNATSGVGNALGLNGTSAPAAGVTDTTATTASTGTPSVAPTPGASGAAVSGSFTNPSGVSNLASQDIGTALNPTSLTGTSLAPTTSLGSVESGSSIPDTSNLGPINATPTTTTTGTGTSLNPTGTNLGGISLPQETGLNTGQGPTIANAAYLPSVTPPSGGTLSGVVNFLTNPKNIPLELGAGYVGLQELQGPPGLSGAEKSLEQQAATLNEQGQAGLAAANANQLTPSQQANVTQYIQNAQNQLYQQLASEGVANPAQDTRYIQGMQNIQQQANTMIQSYVQQTFNNAYSEIGTAASDLGNVANAESQSDSAFTTSLSSAVGSIGSMYGLNQLLNKAA